MKSTGIVRKIDNLGRLVLPVELRGGRHHCAEKVSAGLPVLRGGQKRDPLYGAEHLRKLPGRHCRADEAERLSASQTSKKQAGPRFSKG